MQASIWCRLTDAQATLETILSLLTAKLRFQSPEHHRSRVKARQPVESRKNFFLLVRHGCSVSNNLHELHHAAIFVVQDVAMQNVHAGEIHEPGQHLEIASRGN